MRSIFAPIARTVDRFLGLLETLIEDIRVAASALHGIRERLDEMQPGESAPGVGADDIRVQALWNRVDDLTTAVAEGIKNVQRSENRVRAIVKSARRELADAGYDHAGVEAEALELGDDDGGLREAEPVPAVREDVEDDSERPSTIPGVSVAVLRRVRGW